MTARNDTYALMQQFSARGFALSFDDVNTLRRAQLVLHRWSEEECGDSNDYNSWAIERDEQTDKPYRCIYPHQGEMRRHRIPDREKGTLKRVAEICKRNNLHFYHQTDPRGCALYVSNELLPRNDYTRGVACCA